jgi:hypothetical protein
MAQEERRIGERRVVRGPWTGGGERGVQRGGQRRVRLEAVRIEPEAGEDRGCHAKAVGILAWAGHKALPPEEERGGHRAMIRKTATGLPVAVARVSTVELAASRCTCFAAELLLAKLAEARGLFLLTLHAGFFVMLPATRFGEDAVLLDALVEALQGCLEVLPIGDDYFSHEVRITRFLPRTAT